MCSGFGYEEELATSSRAFATASSSSRTRCSPCPPSSLLLPRRSARTASFRPEIEIDGATTRVLVEQTGAVDLSRLGDFIGHLTAEERWGVDLALSTVLDLH
jgi:mRNA-degrading endonuclease toxin of MazEF toxin-antitoxin module